MTGVITFDDYAENVFIPHICIQSSRRVDVVWDTYVRDSLKESTREKRGKGIRRKVAGGTKLPPNWMQFLRDSVNKELPLRNQLYLKSIYYRFKFYLMYLK